MYLSLCAIAKNETPYLEEWVNFHRAVGVEHFYIYDNESDVPVRSTLKKYVAAGLVTVKDYPGKGKQMPSYDDCLRTYGHTSKWIGFIDCDEFIVPKSKDSVPEILGLFESFGGLAVNWIIFGSNGLQKKPDGLIIENYTMGSPQDYVENRHTKRIVQPALTRGAGTNPHYFVHQRGYFSVSETLNMVHQAWSDNSTNVIQINHYFTKSYDEFVIKCSRGRADVADPNIQGRHIAEFDKFNGHCTVKDECALKFLEKTKSLYL